MKLYEEFKLFETMWDKDTVESTAPADSNTIRCMFALYENDDGYVCKVGVYAGDLSKEEMEDVLTEQGMSFVTCWDEYEYTTSNTYNLGDVVEVFDVDDDDIEDVAAIAGKDPEEYKNVGFFESAATKKLTEARGVADIEADIARLERELAAAKAELLRVRKANLGGKLPTQLYTWDAYKTVAEKGTWTSEIVHETPEAAKAAGEAIVADNLEPGETFDQYTIEVVVVPFSTVSNDTLEDSGLDHLIR